MVIEVQSLNVQYGNKKVLENINLTISSGEIVTIVGPNGSGKTTLFKAIIGSAPIASGKIIMSPSLKVGYVPQVLNVDRSLPLTAERFLSLVTNRSDQGSLRALKDPWSLRLVTRLRNRSAVKGSDRSTFKTCGT